MAKEQLFDCVSRGSSHAGPVILLGVMAAIEGDSETIDAVREELESFRIRDDLDPRDTEGVERVLEGIVELEREESMQTTTLYEMQKNIMLVPWASRGWSRMADFIDGEYPARMALTVAQRNIPPRGVLDPEGLAEAFIKTGVVGDAQRAVMIAPWKAGGWMALADAVAYGSV